MTNTPNHNYNTPAEGTTNWHVPLNENFEQLDVDIEIRGSEADKGEYEPEAGTKYEATDSGAVYYGNGDTWVLADRRINQLGAERVSMSQIQTNNGPLIVSPSINEGYDSLQTALYDAANGKATTILLSENIEENVIIPNSRDRDGRNWNQRQGLTIAGINRETVIQDNQGDGTPIMKVENAGMTGLKLKDLYLRDIGEDTRALSQARYEEGTQGSLPLAHFSHCRFSAPVILSKVYHSYFENCIFRPRVGTQRDPHGTIYPGLMINAGNQYMFDRCHFVAENGETKYATCWMSGGNSGLFNSCYFSMTNEGYNEAVDRPVAPLLIDTGGDYIFNLPYVEQGADYAMVTDSVEGGGNAIDNIRINGSRLGNIKIQNRVKGLRIDGLYQQHEIDVTTGIAEEGSWIRTQGTSVDIKGDNSEYIRVYTRRAKGWEITTPNIPPELDWQVENKYSVPVLVYQSGAKGTSVEDFYGNKRTLPDDSGPIYLGLNERIAYETSVPDEWEWHGME